MASINDILSSSGEITTQVAQNLRQEIEDNLELPEDTELQSEGPTIAEDNTGDWVIAEIELDADTMAEIYALNGAFTLQMYNGNKFLKPTRDIKDLSEQLADI